MEETKRIAFLKSKNVILRPVERSDIPNLLRWINDPDIRDFVAAFLPMMEKGEEEWLDSLAKNRSSDVVLIIETMDGIPIGTLGAHKINWRDRVCTTGAMIGEKEYWGRGFGSEAKMLLLDYLFDTLGLFKVCSQVIAFNKRSYAYSKKCGYKEEGILRKHSFRRGKHWDVINLAVFREDYLKAKKALSRHKG